ncbi:hypothetical protein BHM03_00059322 [Ensete ventricosum]|nr:hypothetical protein BHM03_00059322 [Ensete ventricosum]
MYSWERPLDAEEAVTMVVLGRSHDQEATAITCLGYTLLGREVSSIISSRGRLSRKMAIEALLDGGAWALAIVVTIATAEEGSPADESRGKRMANNKEEGDSWVNAGGDVDAAGSSWIVLVIVEKDGNRWDVRWRLACERVLQDLGGEVAAKIDTGGDGIRCGHSRDQLWNHSGNAEDHCSDTR